MKKTLFNSVKITIKSLNLPQIFSKLIDENIKVFNVKTQSTKMETNFEVDAKEYQKANEILQKLGVNVLKTKKIGLSEITKILVARIGIIIAFFFIIFNFYFLTNFYILNISVTGNYAVSTSEIIKYLSDNNIKTFSKKSSINSSNLELDLISNFTQFSMTSVVMKGACLVINVKEKTEAEILAQKQIEKNIVANFNGRILSINVISGKALKKQGDIVKIGDVLVECESLADTNFQAKANITAEVWLEENYTHNEKQIVVERTGKSYENRQVSFIGITVYDTTKTSNPFSKFDVESSESSLKNTILPLKVKRTIYYECEEKEIFCQYEDVKQEIIKECRQNALQQKLENDIIKSEKIFEQTEGDITNVSYVVIVERQI